MLEAFVDAIHDASPSKLRSDAKGAATRQIKRLKLQEDIMFLKIIGIGAGFLLIGMAAAYLMVSTLKFMLEDAHQQQQTIAPQQCEQGEEG